MNTFVSPSALALRFEANTSFLPSGENIGKPSNVSLYVMRSRPVPSRLIEVDVEVRGPSDPRVRGEDQALAVGMPGRREVGAAKLRDLTQVRAVAIHHEELERRRPPQSFLQQALVFVELGPAPSMRPRNAICLPSHEKNGPPSGPGRSVSRLTSCRPPSSSRSPCRRRARW